MINAIVAASLKLRVLIIGAAVILLGLGVAQLRGASVDEFPEFAPPQVEIQAEALGLSAAEVEQLITVPLEQDLLNGVPWLNQIRSESVPGLSTIDLTFDAGTEILKARQMVQEHLTQAHALPQVGTPPVMIQPTASAARVLMVGLGAKNISLMDLSILARWKIKPRLEGLPGVANVAIWGQRDRQLQVQVDPRKLRTLGVTLSQVVRTTGNALWVSPLTFVEASTPGTGGFVDTPNQRFGIQHVTPITTARSLSAVTVEDTSGRRLTLGQVADVVEDHQPLIGDAVLNQQPGLMLVIEKFPDANTREVTHSVEKALDEMKPGLTGVTSDTHVYRPATYLDSALSNLGVRGLAGLVLAAIVIGLAMLSWRVALMSIFTLLLALVSAGYVMYLRGVTFNLMVLIGLTAAVGVVIGDAISDATGFRRRMRQAARLGEAETADEVIACESGRLRAALTYATVIMLLVPLASLALGGPAGAFARSIVASYAVAIATAMIVALVVTPALGSVLLRPGAERRAAPLDRLIDKNFHRSRVRGLHAPRIVYAGVAVLLLAGLAVLPGLTTRSTLPAVQDRNLTIHWEAAPGTSLPEMARITALATRQLQAVPGVQDVGSHVGRALMADQAVNVNSAEMWVSLDSGADYGSTVEEITEAVSEYPGMRADVSTYPADRVAAADLGVHDPLVVRVYGYDLDTLAAKAADLRNMLTTVPGVVHPAVRAQTVEPSVQIKVKLPAAQRYGITPGDVRRASATYFAGLPVGSLYEDQKIFDVVVWGTPQARLRPTDVSNLLIDTPHRGHVRLGDVASVTIHPAPTVIRHDDISRSLDVTAGVSGRDVDDVLSDVRSRVANMPMPLEFHAEVLSNTATYRTEHWHVAAVALAVALAVLLLLHVAFGSWRLAGLLFLTFPLGVAGAVLATRWTGGLGSLGSLMGMLAVLGIVMRDGVVLLRNYQRRDADPRDPSGVAGSLSVTRAHLTPVVLTALMTAAVVAPTAVLGVVAGTEVLHSFAAVVLAGLISSTLYSAFVLPGLYLRLFEHPADVRG